MTASNWIQSGEGDTIRAKTDVELLYEIVRLRAALERICSVQLDEPKITDPDWKAHLMQKIALEAIAYRTPPLTQPPSSSET